MNARQGFSNVDESADPGLFVDYLDEARRLPQLRDIDRRLVVELRLVPGSHVLDVGCGTGEDTLELAALVAPAGCAVGLDASRVMISEARRRAAGSGLPVEFRTGQAEDIDLPGPFDACRFERVLQHVLDPVVAMREAARVLRPGGRLAAFEPDWTSLVITGASQDVTSRILEARSRAFASPDVGAMLPQLLSEAGFRDVRTSEFHLVTTKVDVAMRVFRLEANVDAAVTGGTISSAEARSWLQALTAAHQWRAFGAQVIGYLVSGTRPAGTQSETCSMR